MRGDVVGRVQPLAFELVGDHGHRTIQFPAHHATEIVLAGKLAALEIETVAVAVVRWLAERRSAGRPDIAILGVALHVAEQKIKPLARPGGAFGPEKTRPQPGDGRIPHDQPVETVIQRQNIGIGKDVRGRVLAHCRGGWVTTLGAVPSSGFPAARAMPQLRRPAPDTMPPQGPFGDRPGFACIPPLSASRLSCPAGFCVTIDLRLKRHQTTAWRRGAKANQNNSGGEARDDQKNHSCVAMQRNLAGRGGRPCRDA